MTMFVGMTSTYHLIVPNVSYYEYCQLIDVVRIPNATPACKSVVMFMSDLPAVVSCVIVL